MFLIVLKKNSHTCCNAHTHTIYIYKNKYIIIIIIFIPPVYTGCCCSSSPDIAGTESKEPLVREVHQETKAELQPQSDYFQLVI